MDKNALHLNDDGLGLDISECKVQVVERDAVEVDAVKIQFPWKSRQHKHFTESVMEDHKQSFESVLNPASAITSNGTERTVAGVEEFLKAFPLNKVPEQTPRADSTPVIHKHPVRVTHGGPVGKIESPTKEPFLLCEPQPQPPPPMIGVVGQTFFQGVASSGRDDEEYNMNHKKRGYAVIFNHFQYKNPMKHRDRHGTDVDVKDLTSTLGQLGFDVIVHQDLPYGEIVQQLKKVSELSHADSDCLLIVVLTHGAENNKLMSYDVDYKAQTLWNHFLADKCIELAGKPKLFVIQACKGDSEEKVVKLCPKTETDGTSMSSRAVSYSIPCNADFLIANSTVEGFAAYRDHGSWYIRSLCRELRLCERNADILKILTRTSRRVALTYQTKADNPSLLHYKDPMSNSIQVFECPTKQMPSFYSTLTRDLYLRPKSEAAGKLTTDF